ncbi:hypothetical protein AMS62_00005, partial [Bacillus sp. FJAT-18019]
MNNISDIYQLSPMQQGMLFHTLYDMEKNNSNPYINQLSFSVQHDLDLNLFNESWEKVIQHYDILRTSFEWEELKNPFQIVLNNVDFSISLKDWSSLSVENREKEITTFMQNDVNTGFVLSKPPLMRVTVIKESDKNYRVIWTFHHLLLDGWSIPLVLRDVFQTYLGMSKGENNILSPFSHYKPYIQWIKSKDEAVSKEFWTKELGDISAPTPVPLRSREEKIINKYHQKNFSISEHQTNKLISWAKSEHITLNTLIQGAWSYLLSYYSGDSTVIFGVTSSGRPYDLEGSNEMVGMLVNTLPTCIKVEKGKKINQWLKELQIKDLERREHEHSSLIDIKEWSQFSRRDNLFDTLFVFENYPVDLEDLIANISVSNVKFHEQNNFPLSLIVTPGKNLSFNFMYCENVISEDSVQELFLRLSHLIEAFISNKSEFISDVSLTTLEEKKFLFDTYNGPISTFKDRTVLQEFENQVRVNPNKIALKMNDDVITYKELNERSNQFAHYLKRKNFVAGGRVVVCLERSFNFVISILGILKAGGAYIPLDPVIPLNRKKYIVNDCGASFVITEEYLDELGKDYIEQIIFKQNEKSIFDGNCDDFKLEISSDDLAYIIYTSGTTGQPKGVMITHENLYNYIEWARKTYTTHTANFPLYSSISFDLTVTSIYLPLICGGSVIIFDQEDALTVLREIFAHPEITAVKLTPSHLKLIEHMDINLVDHSVYTLIVGGENLPTESARKIHSKFKGKVFIYNEYGPTEATVGCMTYLYSPDAQIGDSVPIGEPSDNMHIYVLDDYLQPVPFGVKGEIYISGVGIAKGYLNQPELTKKKFIPNPFFTSEKMYKTGDLAMWSKNGILEYVDRIDNQVKIRGYRIELGEVEAVLSRHPSIQQASVVAKMFREGDLQLVGYVVGDLSRAELRAYLKTQLPEYMIPAYLVELETLPLTPNGKVDTRALPDPEVESEASYVVPRTLDEQQVAEIFSEVLGVKQVGVHDSFFDLGGHSLLATQVVSRLRE